MSGYEFDPDQFERIKAMHERYGTLGSFVRAYGETYEEYLKRISQPAAEGQQLTTDSTSAEPTPLLPQTERPNFNPEQQRAVEELMKRIREEIAKGPDNDYRPSWVVYTSDVHHPRLVDILGLDMAGINYAVAVLKAEGFDAYYSYSQRDGSGIIFIEKPQKT